jgi:diguanylate cyclase (GGDEF)-like protein
MRFSIGDKGKNIFRENAESWDPKKLRQLVLMDDLTGLFNRRYFRLRLDEEEKRCRKNGKKFSLMMVDVNKFKAVNDAHGHLTGDRVLVHVGRILKESVREEDIVCRWAGDEFVVILPEASENEAENVANRIINAVEGFPWEEKCEVEITGVSLSLGYSIFPDDATELKTLIENADRALYTAKKEGKPLRGREPAHTSRRKRGTVSGPAVYGKEEELELLIRTIDNVHREVPQFILIRGDMGVGKTFVVERLEIEAKKMGMVVLSGRCDEEAVDTPLFPFKNLINHFMAQNRETELFSSMKLPEASLTELSKLAPRLTRNMKKENTPRQVGGRDKFLLFEAFSQFLSALSGSTGVIVVIEDIQWADLASLALLQFLARTVDGGRIGIVLTYRPLDESFERGKNKIALREIISIEKEGRFQHVSLSPLSQEDSVKMIKDLLGERKPAEESIGELCRITEGNPFFIKGMVEFLKKSDKVPQTLDSLPPTLHEAIGQRIEKLSPEARTAFQAAAILGKEFEFDVLLDILRINEGYLLDIIDEGIRSNIIEEVQDFSGDRYCFVQNIILKALYSGIPAKERSQLHLQAGLAIEKYDLEGIEDRYGELAHHLEIGGDRVRALDCYIKAARKASELFAHEESISFYTRALKLARSLRSSVEEEKLLLIYEERGLVYQQTNNYSRSQRDFEQVLELSIAVGMSDKTGYALKNLSNLSIFKRELKEAYEYSLRTIKHATRTGDMGLKAESLAAFGNIFLFSGEYKRALNCYRKALELDRRSHDKLRVSKLYTNVGVIHWYQEEYEKALYYYKKAHQLLKELGNKTFQPLCLNNIAMISLQKGFFSKALVMCKEALDVSKETGNRTIEAYSYNNIAEIFQKIGDYDKALEWSRKAVSLIKQIKDQGSRADFMRNRGVDYYFLGEKRRASNDLKKALVLSRSTGKKEYEMNALYWIVRLLVEEGKLEDAGYYLMDFQKIVRSKNSIEYSMKFAIAASILHMAEGKTESALWSITRLVFDGGEVDPYLDMIYHYQTAVVLRGVGNTIESKEEAEKAGKLVTSLSRRIREKELKEIFLASKCVVSIRDLLKVLSAPV